MGRLRAFAVVLVAWVAAHTHTAQAQAVAIPQPWRALADCESGDGDGRPPYRASWRYNGRSGFDGGLQFQPSTWRAYRRTFDPAFAYLAAPLAQIAVGRRVLAAQGWAAWPTCSRRIGLR